MFLVFSLLKLSTPAKMKEVIEIKFRRGYYFEVLMKQKKKIEVLRSKNESGWFRHR